MRGKEKLWQNKFLVYNLFILIVSMRVILLPILGLKGAISFPKFLWVVSSTCGLVVSVISYIMVLGRAEYYASNSSSYGIYWYYTITNISENRVENLMASALITLLMHRWVASTNWFKVSLIMCSIPFLSYSLASIFAGSSTLTLVTKSSISLSITLFDWLIKGWIILSNILSN